MIEYEPEPQIAKLGVRQKTLISMALKRGAQEDGTYLKNHCYVTNRDVLRLYPEMGTSKSKSESKLLILEEYGIFKQLNPKHPVFVLTEFGASLVYAEDFLVDKPYSSGQDSKDIECRAISSSVDGSCPTPLKDEGEKKNV